MVKMKSIIIFGGTGGIGSGLYHYIKERNYFLDEQISVIPLGSKDVDLSKEKEVKSFFECNKPDVIINMSGINYDGFLHKVNLDEVRRLININIMANINILNCVLPYMRKNKYGRIILPSSILAEKTVCGTSIYSASKAFIESLVRVAAAENAKYNITINALRMGYIDAGLTHKISQENIDPILNCIPANRFGTIVEIYDAIDFLINCEYVNGTSLSINGGMNGL